MPGPRGALALQYQLRYAVYVTRTYDVASGMQFREAGYDQRHRPGRTAAAPATGRRPALTREQVLTAALKIIDEEGVEALTMRRLGQALDRDPMAIYRHAADKDALSTASSSTSPPNSSSPASLTKRRGTGIGKPPCAAPRTRSGGSRWPTPRGAAAGHPAAVRPARPAAPGHPATAGGAARGVHHRRVRPHGALHAARLFTGFLYGHVLHELQERLDNPDETDDLLRLGLHRLPITQFPRLRSLATVLATYDGAAGLDEGLAIVLAGLRSQLRT